MIGKCFSKTQKPFIFFGKRVTCYQYLIPICDPISEWELLPLSALGWTAWSPSKGWFALSLLAYEQLQGHSEQTLRPIVNKYSGAIWSVCRKGNAKYSIFSPTFPGPFIVRQKKMFSFQKIKCEHASLLSYSSKKFMCFSLPWWLAIIQWE